VTRPDAATYRITIRGHVDPERSAWLDRMTVTRRDDGTTCIVGTVVDAAALYGVLAWLRDLGAALLVVERLDRDPPGPGTDGGLTRPRREDDLS
jgi:hypothetical protein